MNRAYTHNDGSVMAFTRKSGNEEYLVVGSLNHQNLDGYNMPLPPGNWKEVLNSDAALYGGSAQGNMGGVDATPIPLHGRRWSVTLTLPPLGAVFLVSQPDVEAITPEEEEVELEEPAIA